MVATKEIPEDVWAEWDAGYQAAASDLDNRDEKVRAGSCMLRRSNEWQAALLFIVSGGTATGFAHGCQ